ncbi:sigma-54-dependent Fis family transcriptional regulator [Rhodohalobacter sp. SW132]|uniref:sigma-54-dependent transcriptional regulator n=1 Tax=Rhodohalobacter sp. SW132 TaxID=2293433 RepID=UPI000E22BF77|nr:sigma-54 dependent transcriptional regulator [Rhodohalobacter sp. SW132]REL38648.1 sigma-54-dependent Fis family transcriptional regulator [Rhodohalobacter sp. SW132]
MKGKILLLDDDKLLLGFMDEHLSLNDFETVAFDNPVKATDYLKENEVDLVITDVKMNEMTGDEILAFVNKHHPDTGVIMITGFGNIQHSVNALRKGAYDYITKPFKAKEIIFRVERYFTTDPDDAGPGKPSKTKQVPRKKELEKTEHVKYLKKEELDDEMKFVGNDPNIKKLTRILPKIAQNDAPIMIQGESGTGKEVFAHQIHANSNRAKAPYIKINCANLPSELVESTLFGHKKGAFTGAIEDRKGAFDEASGGTLLLDEITEIEIKVQAKLLRVLQEKEFYRVGSQKPISADVRIIATSNRNIGQAISDGSFREDLYYRLNVFPISIPPLRYRKGDIPLLANHFVDRYSKKYNVGEKVISDELMDYLMNQEWRGNVRELDNKIHRGVILSHDSKEITTEHIDNQLFSNVDDEIGREVLSDLPLMSIEDMELHMIKKTLEHTQGNQKEASKLLGISDRTIRNKLKNLDEDS